MCCVALCYMLLCGDMVLCRVGCVVLCYLLCCVVLCSLKCCVGLCWLVSGLFCVA